MAIELDSMLDMFGRTIYGVHILERRLDEPQRVAITFAEYDSSEYSWGPISHYIVIEADTKSQYYSDGSGGYYTNNMLKVDSADYKEQYEIGVISEEEFMTIRNEEIAKAQNEAKEKEQKKKRERINFLTDSIALAQHELTKLKQEIDS